MREAAFAFGWAPAAFWGSTALDVLAGAQGALLRAGLPRRPSTGSGLRAEMEEMIRRFPD